MREPPATPRLRLIATLVALYAFALQGFLAAALPKAAWAGAGAHELCRPGEAEGPSQPPHAGHGDCCLAACPQVWAAPTLPSSPVAWPDRTALAAPLGADAPGPPPGRAAALQPLSARGPPPA